MDSTSLQNILLIGSLGLFAFAIWYVVSAARHFGAARQEYRLIAPNIRKLVEAERAKTVLESSYHKLQSDYKRALNSVAPLEKILHDSDLGIGSTDRSFYVSDLGQQSLKQLERSLETVRSSIKEMVSLKTACLNYWGPDIRINNSKSATTKFINREIKLRIRCLDNEFKMARAIVDWNNISRLIDRCREAFRQINELGELVETKLQTPYLELKISELKLIHEINQVKQREKEELQAENARIREAEREEERIRKAAEKAKKDRELMEKLVQQELEKLDIASAEQVQQLETLKSKLAELKEKEQRAVSMAQITRAGYIYVITNEASFGDAICKVGMTRRVNPLDRVKELGDASVPSLFDVQYLAYTEDAPKLERYLHAKLEDKRVNLVNRRKEFFTVDSKSVIDLLSEYDGKVEAVVVEG